MEPVKLESERLLIRPFKIGDEQAMFELNSNSLVQKYTGDKLVTTKKQAEEILHNIVLKDYQITDMVGLLLFISPIKNLSVLQESSIYLK